MDLLELIDQTKKTANIETDYALAKVLGVNNGDIAHWKKGKKHPSIETATKMAILAKIPEMDVIAMIELLTAKTDEKRKFWKHYIESRGITACIAMTTLAASIILTPEPAEASVLQLQNYDAEVHFLSDKNIHYANKR